MNFFRKLKLSTQLSIWISLVILTLFLSFGYWGLHLAENYLANQQQEQINRNLIQITQAIDIQFEQEQKNLDQAIELAEFFLLDEALLTDDTTTTTIEGINEINGEQDFLNVRDWKIDGQRLYGNQDILEEIHRITQMQISIFQKTNRGYIRISTNLIDTEGNVAVGYFIPPNHRLFQFIENGKTYKGFLKSKLLEKQGTYKPLYLNNRIQGMIAVEKNKKLHEKVRNLFYQNHDNAVSYFLFEKNGKILAHTNISLEGTTSAEIIDTDMLSTFDSGEIKKYNQAPNQAFYYRYLKQHQAFIIAQYNPQQNIGSLYYVKLAYLAFMAIAVFILTFVVARVIKATNNSLNAISNTIVMVAKGQIDSSIDKTPNKELHQIIESVDELKESIKHTIDFALDIKDGNYTIDYQLNSPKDALGRALLEMRNNLIQARETDQKRLDEDARRKWHNDGMTKINEILRYQDNLDQLNYNIISNLVKYLQAIQGGLFLIQEKNQQKKLRLLAVHAYNEQKLLQKEIPIDVGIIGRAIIEERSIYLEEVPENYLEITSGLGAEKPASILIVPLVFSGEIMGVIEIASFKKIQPYQIEFLEQVSESIASTLINIKINNETKKLLDKTRNQSEQMVVQEEKLRHNLQELQHLQKQTKAQSIEMQGILTAVKASTLVAEFDLDGTILDINHNFLKVFGLNRNEVIGRNRAEFAYFVVERAKFLKIWGEMRKGNSHTRIEQYKLSDNHIVWLNENYTPVLDQNKKLYKVLNIAIDISQTKIKQEEFRQLAKKLSDQEQDLNHKHSLINRELKEVKIREKQLNTIITAFNQNLINMVFSIELDLISVNKPFLQMSGYSQAETENAKLYNILPDNNADKIKKEFAKLAKGDHALVVLRIYTKQQEIRWLKSLLIPIFDSNGLIEKIELFAIDISGEKILQEEGERKSKRADMIEKELHKNIAELNEQLFKFELEKRQMEQTIEKLRKK